MRAVFGLRGRLLSVFCGWRGDEGVFFFFFLFSLQSLARALAALVEARRTSESFQLILITHDEHFVMHLSRHGLVDKFYKISKTLNGESRIASCELQGF